MSFGYEPGNPHLLADENLGARPVGTSTHAARANAKSMMHAETTSFTAAMADGNALQPINRNNTGFGAHSRAQPQSAAQQPIHQVLRPVVQQHDANVVQPIAKRPALTEQVDVSRQEARPDTVVVSPWDQAVLSKSEAEVRMRQANTSNSPIPMSVTRDGLPRATFGNQQLAPLDLDAQPAPMSHTKRSYNDLRSSEIDLSSPSSSPVPSELDKSVIVHPAAAAEVEAPASHAQEEEQAEAFDLVADEEEVFDVDEEDRAQNRDFGEYMPEVMLHLREREIAVRPAPSYMQRQNDINGNMRAVLVDWLVDVALEYRLKPETLYLAIGYIDRFLSELAIARSKLQLLGIACMFVAAKFEEIFPPNVHDFFEIADRTYEVEQIIRMEQAVLKTLRFYVSQPTLLEFINRALKVVGADAAMTSLCYYLGELTLLDDAHLVYLPSVIAAAVTLVAHYTLTGSPRSWTAHMAYWTGYSIEDVCKCAADVFVMFRNTHRIPRQPIGSGNDRDERNRLAAVHVKYSEASFHRVALLEPPEQLPEQVMFALAVVAQREGQIREEENRRRERRTPAAVMRAIFQRANPFH
ncbi:cyclin A [Capsaspora owczarzaki ATCC 30864]|uniref:Cyclin A n=1 Tax=Capsaspora owczarzaki (strain ATCC 30864) TaxID=595528 RepID=A0A0D2VSF5_CAPO3|nr:cyclin A [Capsaspora owczarzaki ATCC 30864]KJE94017.1 cyclin A [Capsaspora owczarzaki ATCC 30864]|eukprot:XP_004347466.1 cyclin A [Capsaspora owczarzaki ATCC 30864]